MLLGYLSRVPGSLMYPYVPIRTHTYLESMREHLEPTPKTNILQNNLSVSRTGRVSSHHLHIIHQMERVLLFCRGCVMVPPHSYLYSFTGFNQAKTQKFKSSLLSTKLQKILSLIIACRPNWGDVMLIVPVILVNVQYVLVPVNYLWTQATIMREKVIFHALKGILMNWLPPI